MALCPLNIENQFSHIAFLIKSGKIVHIGTNSRKSHPKIQNYPYISNQSTRLHAELSVCIKSGKENLSNYKMIVLRVNRNGKLANSRPCVGCQGVIKQFNIDEVWHSDSSGNVVLNSTESPGKIHSR